MQQFAVFTVYLVNEHLHRTNCLGCRHVILCVKDCSLLVKIDSRDLIYCSQQHTAFRLLQSKFSVKQQTQQLAEHQAE